VADLLVVSGPPGAGKSTVAALIAARSRRSVMVEGDRFFNFLASGSIDPWLKEANEQNAVVLEAAAVATASYVRHGYSTVYDGVLGPWFLPQFLEATGLTSLHYAVLLPDEEHCVERVTMRTAHHFRDGPATRTMHAQFARADISRRHLVEADASPDEIADDVRARHDAGRLVWPG
jgi:2-phosphoglycerate kinase